jgi:hypothetical protein
MQYINRRSAGLCVQCGFARTIDGKARCESCGEEHKEQGKAYYAKRVKNADGELCKACLRNKPTPGWKSCTSCRILRSAKHRKQGENAKVANEDTRAISAVADGIRSNCGLSIGVGRPEGKPNRVVRRHVTVPQA